MTCNRIDTELVNALGEAGDPDPAGELAEHLRSCEACSARLRTYRLLTGMITSGATEQRLPPEWRERTMARVRASRGSRARRWPIIAATAIASAAALALFSWWWRTGAQPSPLDRRALAIRIVGETAHRGEGHPGQELHANAQGITAPHVEIRIYRGGSDLLVRCPSAGPPVCRPDGSVVWPIPAPGRYQILLLAASQPIAAPIGPMGSLDEDLAAARASGGAVFEVQTLDVR